MQTRLQAPQTKGHTSVARVTDAWYVIAPSKAVGRKPITARLMGTPLVVFRDGEGTPRALLDRCPHRNVPLSRGKVCEGQLECAYHGWRFDGGGECRRVPGLSGPPESRGRRVPAWPVIEQQGFIWAYGRPLEPEETPKGEPYRFPHADDDGYTTVRHTIDAEGSVHAVIENALDVPHTAFLHRGLFRGAGEPNTLEVEVRRWHDRVEAEYFGEPAPKGLVGRLVAPGSNGTVKHVDRFLMPSISEVEYQLGEKSHMVVSSACTPIDDFYTRLYAVVSFKLPLPGWLVGALIKPVALRIFNQDAVMLKAQTKHIQTFGGEQFVSTEIDALGQSILKLLRQAERGVVEKMETPETRRFNLTI
ncbi:MAG: Rieske 2Fe-2S domain-containing protein [Bradymonadia bacterium]